VFDHCHSSLNQWQVWIGPLQVVTTWERECGFPRYGGNDDRDGWREAAVDGERRDDVAVSGSMVHWEKYGMS
jgi:hypothetical protein